MSYLKWLVNSFKFVVFGDEKAHESLIAGATPPVPEPTEARVVKRDEGYAVIVGKETIKTYSRKGDAVRGAKRLGFAAVRVAQ